MPSLREEAELAIACRHQRQAWQPACADLSPMANILGGAVSLSRCARAEKYVLERWREASNHRIGENRNVAPSRNTPVHSSTWLEASRRHRYETIR